MDKKLGPCLQKTTILIKNYFIWNYHQKYFLRKYPQLLRELMLDDAGIITSPIATRLIFYQIIPLVKTNLEK